ncbi:MAG: ATP-binding protein [Syntrophaceae bacterium]|nr:GAF domain-containing protein [Pseudomonadota bacterium]MCG2741538.1 ATP-binding protein [Syntrophaceae bacterium]
MVPNALQAVSAYVIPPLLGFIVLLGLALVSLLRGGRKRTNILFAGICLLGALFNADMALVSIVPDERLALRVDRTVHFFFVFSIPIYILFVHAFLGIRGRRWLEVPAWLFSIAFLTIVPTDLYLNGFHHYSFGRIARAGVLFHLFSATVAFTVIYCLAVLYHAMKESADNHQRNRIKYIFGGLGFSALLLAFTILPVSGVPVYPLGNFSFIPAIFLAFGVLKYDLLDIGALIRRGTVYFLLTGILTALYVLVIFLFHTFFLSTGSGDSFVLSLVLALIIVLLFTPLRERVQSLIDRLFFRGCYDYRELLREISGKMASILSISQIRGLLLNVIHDALQVERASLVLAEGGVFRFYNREKPDGEGEPSPKGVIPLIRFLTWEKGPLNRVAVEKLGTDAETREAFARLFDLLGAVLVIPIPSREGLAGLICLGQKKSGELFVDEDLELLTTMANQAATAIENARSYEAMEALNRDLERKVEKRTAALQEALAEKERTQQQLIRSESLAAIGQLVAGTAHELNNPIAGAMSLVETSVETIAGWEMQADKRDEILEDLRFSIGELRRSAAIIRSLLDLSRQTQTYVEAVDMNRAVDDALRVLHNQYKNLPVEIVKAYDDALPAVEGNFANLGQVLINIIRNALQALTEGKGRITLTTRQPSADIVAVECRDTGIGIPAAYLKDIFKPFFTTKAVGRGTGLGLYLSHEIIRRHGGQIRVESAEGKGTVLTVELPCKRREA